MTITLPLELADLPGKTPPPTVVQEQQFVHTVSADNKQQSRSKPKSTSKCKPNATRISGPTGPVYQQFGILPSNPTYHLARVGEAIRQARNVIVISGAGVSTPAIPDFRSSRGLFKTLADETRRNAMFREKDAKDDEMTEGEGDTEQDEGEDSQEKPERQRKPRRRAAATTSGSAPSLGGMKSGKELFDVKCLTSPDLLPHHHNLLNHLTLLTSRTSPTPFHHYLKTLDDQGRLLRCYTQNIDGLEEKAGLDLRIPLEADFPKRRRTGMSRESSRKSDVFGKNNAKEEQTMPPSQSLVDGQGFGANAVPFPTMSADGPAVLPPLQHTADHLASGNTEPYYNSHKNAGFQQSFPSATHPHTVSHSAFGGFPLVNDIPSYLPDMAQAVTSQPYAANIDPFCSFQATALTDGQGLSELFTATGGLDSQQRLEVGSGDVMARAASAARSVSGTTNTSATSVSARVDVSRDTDNDRDSDKEAAAPDQLPLPKPVTATGTTNFFVEIPVPQSQSEMEPVNVPKLPRCVPLHGTLANLECTRCSYSQPLRDAVPLPLELIPCPSCEDAWEERVESSQRPRSIGFLRASVLLYGEEHKHGESIGAVVERDLLGRLKDERMDLLIVAGTTLQIPGVKRMIKEFAKALRTQAANKKKPSRKSAAGDAASVDKESSTAASSRSRTVTSLEDDIDNDANEDEDFPIQTILLNRDPPGKGKGGEWANTFDVWVQGDLQDFVQQWVVDGPPSGEIPKSKEAEHTVIPAVAPTPNVKSRIEVTKVEGTKIRLTVDKTSANVTQSMPSQQIKRKQPPSPVKTAAKGKTQGPKKSKAQPTISFPSKKPGIKASPQKVPRTPQPPSPETLSSGSERVCVMIPIREPAPPRVAIAPRAAVTRPTARARPATVARPSTRSTRSQSSAAPPLAPPCKARKPRTKLLRLPTRHSTRQRNAASQSATSSSFLPVTPKKRSHVSTSSSPLSSAPSSDDESAECSSQGIIETALSVGYC